MARSLQVVFLLVLLVLVLKSQAIDDACIKCLCEAISKGPTCNYQEGCHDGVCGPYAITWPYWADAGKPTKGLEDRNIYSTYERCTTDVTCSEATIRGYMDRFHQDCNQDGREDCLDYAAVHFHGGYGCNKPLDERARYALTNCLERFSNYPQPQPVPYDNNVIPYEPSTYPSIDIRFGEDDSTTDDV